MLAAAIALICLFCSVFAGWWHPQPVRPDHAGAERCALAPGMERNGLDEIPLGTDDQGPRHPVGADLRRAHLARGRHRPVVLSVVVAWLFGLLAGFQGGWVDAVLMRLCDVMLSFPRHPGRAADRRAGPCVVPNAHESLAFGVLIISISPHRLGAICPHGARLHAGGAQQGIRRLPA